MAKSRDAIPKPSPLAGKVQEVDQATFKKLFDAWLRQHEAAKPFHELRELEDRIKKGDLKLKAAEQRGVSPDDASYKAAVEKLGELRKRRDELTRTAQVPFLAFNTAHNFLRATRGWGLPFRSRITIDIPDWFGVSVDVSESEIPF